MKLAYVTTYDSTTLTGSHEWSGSGYYIAQSLKFQGIDIDHLGPLTDPALFKAIRKLKRHYYELVYQKHYEKNSDPQRLKNYAHQITRKLAQQKAQIVFSATVEPIAYLECDLPIAFWADATFANLIDFYPQYSNLHPNVVYNWHKMEKLALEKCQLAIYSSDWAAQSAINFYQADPNKVKVVPFGANINNELDFTQIKDAIASRPTDICKLLFIGVEWIRKGGDIAYSIAKQLNHQGLKTELTIVGCQPEIDEPMPKFIKSLGFISKSTNEGKEKIQQLILDSHFLILPTRADCTPIVFCEANYLGVPCLSTNIGGVPTIVHNDLNGKLFNQDTQINDCCDYITNIFANYSNYLNLALSAFHEYSSRLNWSVAGATVKKLLAELEK